MKEYIILGDPIPLARARHGGGKTWDPQKHLKLNWSLKLAEQHDDEPLFEGPLHLDVTFFMAKPKTSAKQTALMQDKPHYCKPDLDNMLKWVFDCSNKILYHDDSCIASVHCDKRYSDIPRTSIKVSEINGK
jgi:Holliday junction resolvase RusA-like endonuclease